MRKFSYMQCTVKLIATSFEIIGRTNLKKICIREQKKRIQILQLKMLHCLSGLHKFSLCFLYMKWIQNESWEATVRGTFGDQCDLQIVHLCFRQMTWLMYFCGKLPACSQQDLYKVPKGTLTSAAAVLSLIIMATIRITDVVTAVERECTNVCNT